MAAASEHDPRILIMNVKFLLDEKENLLLMREILEISYSRFIDDIHHRQSLKFRVLQEC